MASVSTLITGYSEVGIALDLGSRDRAFESHYSDQKKPPEMAVFLYLVEKLDGLSPFCSRVGQPVDV